MAMLPPAAITAFDPIHDQFDYEYYNMENTTTRNAFYDIFALYNITKDMGFLIKRWGAIGSKGVYHIEYGRKQLIKSVATELHETKHRNDYKTRISYSNANATAAVCSFSELKPPTWVLEFLLNPDNTQAKSSLIAVNLSQSDLQAALAENLKIQRGTSGPAVRTKTFPQQFPPQKASKIEPRFPPQKVSKIEEGPFTAQEIEDISKLKKNLFYSCAQDDMLMYPTVVSKDALSPWFISGLIEWLRMKGLPVIMAGDPLPKFTGYKNWDKNTEYQLYIPIGALSEYTNKYDASHAIHWLTNLRDSLRANNLLDNLLTGMNHSFSNIASNAGAVAELSRMSGPFWVQAGRNTSKILGQMSFELNFGAINIEKVNFPGLEPWFQNKTRKIYLTFTEHLNREELMQEMFPFLHQQISFVLGETYGTTKLYVSPAAWRAAQNNLLIPAKTIHDFHEYKILIDAYQMENPDFLIPEQYAITTISGRSSMRESSIEYSKSDEGISQTIGPTMKAALKHHLEVINPGYSPAKQVLQEQEKKLRDEMALQELDRFIMRKTGGKWD